jgi:hypothetical protein
MPARLLRRVVAAAAVAVLAALTVPALEAPAADRCAVSISLPSKVTIDRSYKEVKVALKDPCKKSDWAAFDLYGPQGADQFFYFDGNTTDYWDVYDFQTLGSFKTRDSFAYDRSYDELPVTEVTTKVKLGTRAAISSKRSGSRVTLSVSASGYNVDADKFVAWSHPSAKLQYKSGSTWKYLKTVKLSGGKGSYTYTQSSKRTYRLVLEETSRNWSATSSTTTR